MSKINLLPWREARKKIRNKIFYFTLITSIGASVVFTILIDSYLSYRIAVENANIQYINKELRSAKNEVTQVQALQKNKKQLLDRMHIIQTLQADRPSAVKLLDMLPRVLPEGVYLTDLNRKEATLEPAPEQNLEKLGSQDIKKNDIEEKRKYNITLLGVALTNGNISLLLKKLESIKWISNIKLNEVAINKDGDGLNFNIEFTQNLEDRG